MKLLAALLLCVSTGVCAQVRISYEGDTLKGNIKKMTEYEYNWTNHIKKVYTYDVAERLEMASFYRENDTTVEAKWLAKFDENGRVIETGLYCHNDTPCQVVTHKYDSHGREVERNFVQQLNGHCNRLSDWLMGGIANWVTGEFTSVTSSKYEYDNIGRLKEMKEVFFRVGTERSDTTIEITSYTYDSNNNNVAQMKKEKVDIRDGFRYVETIDVSRTWKDEKRQEDQNEYDKQGNIIEKKRDGTVLLTREIEYY